MSAPSTEVSALRHPDALGAPVLGRVCAPRGRRRRATASRACRGRVRPGSRSSPGCTVRARTSRFCMSGTIGRDIRGGRCGRVAGLGGPRQRCDRRRPHRRVPTHGRGQLPACAVQRRRRRACGCLWFRWIPGAVRGHSCTWLSWLSWLLWLSWLSWRASRPRHGQGQSAAGR